MCLSLGRWSWRNLSQPTLRRDGEGQIDKPKCSSSREKTCGVATNVYLRKTLEKTKRSLRIFENKGSGVVYAWGRYWHPTCLSQGTTVFNQVYTMWLQNYLFSPFYIFILFFWGRQGCCPCSYVSSGAMRNSYLRSSLSLNVCVLNWFYVFERFILIINKRVI